MAWIPKYLETVNRAETRAVIKSIDSLLSSLPKSQITRTPKQINPWFLADITDKLPKPSQGLGIIAVGSWWDTFLTSNHVANFMVKKADTVPQIWGWRGTIWDYAVFVYPLVGNKLIISASTESECSVIDIIY